MAHDINTPIASIKMSIKTLQRTAQDELSKELLNSMEVSATHIIDIVNSLRNQIRNMGDTQKEKFKISEILEDIKLMTSNEFAKYHCELVININKDLELFGEPNKITQALMNIIINSVQAYSACISEGEKKVIITTLDDERYNRIEIQDYACGISEKIAPHLFKQILTTKGTAGTGVGLYITYSIIKGLFGGDITFESEVGKGTLFKITIPKNINMEGK